MPRIGFLHPALSPPACQPADMHFWRGFASWDITRETILWLSTDMGMDNLIAYGPLLLS